jgi:hypothetical protein
MEPTTIWTLLLAAGTALGSAVKVLWTKVSTELDDCKKDRITLFQKVDGLQLQLNDVSTEFAELRGEAKHRKQSQQQS